jgi:hypothetical protein
MEVFPIEFKRGEQYAFTLVYVNNDGTLFDESTDTVSCSLAIKESYESPIADITLTKGNGISYNPATAEFSVSIPSSSTADITWNKGVYDMWITSNTNGKDYVLDGEVTVLPNVA